jgi:hypothetical protein
LVAAQASYSPAWAAAFIPGVQEAAADPAPASAPRNCFRPEVEDDEGVRWAGPHVGFGLVGCGQVSVSLFFADSFLLFTCFLI